MIKALLNNKKLALLLCGLIAPQLINVSLSQPPPPPPPPELVPLTGITIAVVILAAVGMGVYTIYKQNKLAKANKA